MKPPWGQLHRRFESHREEHKAQCNANGAFVAPGETIDAEGVISGDPPETTTLSFWISGFCSPFKTIGERAERYLRALASGEQDKIQTAVNAGFGELYLAGGGEVPEWTEVVKMRESFAQRVPDQVLFLVAAVDVQGNRLPYVIRGFGAQGTSWLIEHGYIWGPTKDEDVWRRLSEKLTTPIDDRLIKIAFVDSGFRPDKKESLPIHRVYEFCRKHKRFVFATIRSKNTKPEVLTRSAVQALGMRFRNHVESLPGTPDLANKTRKWAIFVHGCYRACTSAMVTRVHDSAKLTQRRPLSIAGSVSQLLGSGVDRGDVPFDVEKGLAASLL